MKTKLRFLRIIAAAAVIVFTFLGCPEQGNPEPDNPDPDIPAQDNPEPDIPEPDIPEPDNLIEMVWIPAGTFTMGSPAAEPGRWNDETQRQITLTSGFYMSKYLVTQEQYETVMGITIQDQNDLYGWGLYGIGDNYPMYYVNWYDTIVFCNRLSIQEGLTPAYSISGSTNPDTWGNIPEDINTAWNNVQIVEGSTGYRLPTEAQWEYACRAGTTTAFNWGTNQITSEQANFNASDYLYNDSPQWEYRRTTTAAGTFAPNAWGIYDMHGNVLEWCWDWHGTYTSGDQTDPAGAVTGYDRVCRGGDWSYEGRNLRSAYRGLNFPSLRSPGIGFRIVRFYLQGNPAQDTPDIDTPEEPDNVTEDTNGMIEMVWIPAGTFTIGSPAAEPGRWDDEIQRQITLTNGFYIGKYQVTQEQYETVMGTNPSFFAGTTRVNLPVENVSWYDAIVFCNRLSIQEGLTPAYSISGSTNPDTWGNTPMYINPAWDNVQIVEDSTGYRLPTEAQWEYACRAGTTTAFNWGTNQITSEQANFYAIDYLYNGSPQGEYRWITTSAGTFAPNAWGLYDMHGNVWEWCWDWDWYGIYALRVIRGGSWGNSGSELRSAIRAGNEPWYGSIVVGFRLVRFY